MKDVPTGPGGSSNAGSPGAPPPGPRNPLSALSGGRFNLAESIGGTRGVVDNALPGIVFVTVFGIVQQLDVAIWAALAVGAVLAAIRLARRETLQHALGGFVGIAIAAFIAQRSGRAENFFLPSLLKNVGWAAAYLVSILVRWPLLGFFVGPLTGEGLAWRRDPARLRAYSRASWIWVGVFALRAGVQYPLWVAGAVTALGVVSVILGLPLFALAIYLSWLILRRVPPARSTAARTAEPIREG